jgi:glycerol-3-phosphate O-acyltransferase
MAQASSPPEPEWPAAGGQRVVFLLDASSAQERRHLEAWIERHRPPGCEPARVERVALPPSRRRLRRPRRRAEDADLEALLASGEDALLAPLRVVWLPDRRGGVRSARWSDLLRFRDPYDPGPLHAWWLRARAPERCRIVAGGPAPASELRARWREAGGTDHAQTTGLADFVVRQAHLALERAERGVRGARYKVPRLVREDVLGRPSFRGQLARLARQLGRPERSVAKQADRYLREIAATHSPYVIDLVAHLIRALYSRAYGEALHYDREKLAGVFRLTQQHPVVFLPTHKSNLDHLVLQYALHENGHPPNHTAGGINMNFFPVGPLVRRSGVFFIRRSFKDNEVYKLVLRSYIDYLVEKRFSLEWYIEGGRSRSGKLLPPRFGLLAYVVDAYRRAKSEDVYLIPVSIAYDQISEVGSYAAEQQGVPKERESFGWFVRLVRALGTRQGEIHIRFGDPLSLRAALGPPEPDSEPNADESALALQKLAFEVCVRINRATPISPTSLVALALLGTGGRALTVRETRAALENLVRYVARRKLPTTVDLAPLETDSGVETVLEQLVAAGGVSRFDDGTEAVYRIGPDEELAVSYYRNSIVHFFVDLAIAELALLRASEPGVADPAAELWEECMRLRDLLKFDFFFAEKDEFRRRIREELAVQDGDWEAMVAGGAETTARLVRSFRPFSSHRVLRPFLESYRVVADLLARSDAAQPVDEARFLEQSLGLGRQYGLQRRIHSNSSISRVLFQTALRLARNRGLLDAGAADLAARRETFAREIRDVLRRVDAVDALARSRRAGLIP